MKNVIGRWIVGFIVVSLLWLWASSFQLRVGEVAVVTRFGDPRRIVEESGLYFKLPVPIERAVILDARRRVYETRFAETLTKDKKNVILSSYIVWAVGDPLKFIQAVGTLETAEVKLDGMVSNAKNAVMGKYELSSLVSTDEENLKIDQIEKEILRGVSSHARDKLGAEVLQVGLKRVALPEENVRFVFQQMRAEREQFAAKAIAEGKREAAAIRSETDVEKSRILAKAMEKAARIRGEAEAEAARLYAAAQRKDPEFYEFLRSLESLKKMLKSNSTVVLRTDAAPFRVLVHESVR